MGGGEVVGRFFVFHRLLSTDSLEIIIMEIEAWMIRSLDERSFIFTYILDESRRIRSYSHHLISIDRYFYLI